jgi:hypothetical protein
MKFPIVSKSTRPFGEDLYFILTIQTGPTQREIVVSGKSWHEREVGSEIEIHGAIMDEFLQSQLDRIEKIDKAFKEYRAIPVTRGGIFEARMQGTTSGGGNGGNG